MANSDHLFVLRSGVQKWNEWRLDNPNDAPNLSGADLSGLNLHAAHLSGAHLSGAHLRGAHLSGADLSEADLSWANLSGANLSETNLIRASLIRANLSRANLSGAILGEAHLSGAILSEANLGEANLGGANLSGVILSGAILSGAILSGANLSGANLSGAILMRANLSGANLGGANLGAAILGEANLSRANLGEANLSWANLSGAILHGTDLRKAIVLNTNLSEEDLDGALYEAEQLGQMNLRQSVGWPLIVTGTRALLKVRFNKQTLPVLHLVQLMSFLEYFYNTVYLFLFSQYDSIDDLQNVLSGNIYHRLHDSSDALHIMQMSTSAISLIELISLYAPALLLTASLKQDPKEISIDIHKRIMDIIFKTDEQREKEQLLTVDIISKNADALKKCRELGADVADVLSPSAKKKILPAALLEKLAHIGEIIGQNKESLDDRVPREDYLKAVLFLRQEGFLTNKLKDFDLANLLEILAEHLRLRHQRLAKDTGGFIIEIEQLSDEESQKLTERLTKKE